MATETVRVWDAWDKEISGTVDAWDTWEKVKEQKGFPGGLIAFLQTSTDHDGCGFHNPTIVQAYSWPVLQSGQDLVGVAKTGSGKTLAFLLPGFIKLRKLKKSNQVDTSQGPALLAMTPTRELCNQVYSDAEKFGKPVQITAACAYGGAPKRDQEWAIKQGPDCLIATPGRLNDFIDNRAVNLDQCRFAVLDEADRMLDMGFEPQIRKIMDAIPSDRQTCMFTATWPRECKKLADRYITNPVQIQIGSDDITTNKNIRQHIEVCSDDKQKREALKRILEYLGHSGNCLVFCNTKRKCRDLAWELAGDRSLGLPAEELHGDLDQAQRDAALGKFRSGEARVLVATDVAARGLDIRNISTVVNYDAPNDAESYVHRIGRTGRAGDKGDAYTFLASWGEEKKAANIVGIMEKAQQEVPQSLQDLVGSGGGGGGNSWGEEKQSWKSDEGKKDDGWGKSDDRWGGGKDEWWKKEEEKKDEWWKKEDWKGGGEGEKKEEWKQEDWRRGSDDSWRRGEGGGGGGGNSWRRDEGGDNNKKNSWDRETGGERDAGGNSWSWREQSQQQEERDKERERDGGAASASPERGRGDDLTDQEPGSLISLLTSGKRPAAFAESGGPRDKRPRCDVEAEAEAEAEEAEMEKAEPEEDPTSVEALVQAGQGTRLKIADLKCWLEDRGLPTQGVKTTLIARVQEVLADNA